MLSKQIAFYLGSTIIVLLIVALIFWQYSKPQAVHVLPVTKGKAIEAVYATAIVEPVTWAAIAPIKTGRIVELNVDEGNVVNTGDILARLDDADYQARVLENEALEEYYANEFERAQKLIKTGAISKEKYDQRKTQLAQIRAKISMFKEQIRQLALTAPMDGTVLWRDVELGEVKEAGKPLFWVGQPRPLRLEAEVDEEDIPKIKSGQSVLITADAFPEEVLEGLVHWISPKGDPVSKSYRVYITLPEDTKLMIGMTVETNTIVKRKDSALLIPAKALLEGSKVWIAHDDKAHKVAVKTGIQGEEKIEVLDGVKENDLIIVPPFDNLSDGSEIRTR